MADGERYLAYTHVRRDILRLVPGDASSILDVGCSNGALGAALRELNPGRKIWGIERDDILANEAKTRLDRVLETDLSDFDWGSVPASFFDCIIFADVLEHLSDPWATIAGSLRCLKSGGAIVVSLPNIRHLSAIFSICFFGTFPKRQRGIFDSSHLRWFTRSDLKDMLADLGLKELAWEYSLRIGDQGGGILNRILNHRINLIRRSWFMREFFSYQISCCAIKL